MKKVLSLALCLAMIMTSLVFAVGAADNLSITVVSDRKLYHRAFTENQKLL